MKITPQKYALALIQLLEKNEDKAQAIISDFVRVLAKNNDLRLAPEIIKKLGQAFDRESGFLEAEVITAQPIGKETLEEISRFLRKEAGAQKTQIKTSVDKNILGGLILKYKDKILDASLKTKLENLKNKMQS